MKRGRPKKFKTEKERATYWNKKRPRIRVTPEELIDIWLHRLEK